MEDLPPEVLRDLWLARFGPVVAWDDATYAVFTGGEKHWSKVYTALANAGYTVLHTGPLRIVVNQEKM
jgi:hypothetical protein